MNAPVAGDVLAGKYRVERILGRGGMGIVVAATHLQLGQHVAIKFLVENASKEITARFIREARAAVRLRSEHVARVLDVGELANGAPYMVMEYLEGSDLSHVVRSRGPMPVTEAVEYLLHTCEAIAEAHAHGIIHRDLKPANLFLTHAADGSNTIKVLDFGISKTLGDQVDGDGLQLTQTASVLGSPLYMSPEQLRSAREVTVQSDIWSLGAILYQLLAAQVPFNTTTFSELILMVNQEAPPRLSTFRSDVHPGLEAIIFRCLEKKQAARFANVADLAWAIVPHGPPDARVSAEKSTRTLEGAGVRVSRTSEISGVHAALPAPTAPPEQSTTQGSMLALASSAEATGQRSRRRGWIVIGGAVVGLGIAATLGIMTLRNPARLPEQSVASATTAEVSPPPTATAAAATTANPVTTASPSGAPVVTISTALPSATTAAIATTAPRVSGPLPSVRPGGPAKAPTAAPATTPKNPLDIKIKD